MRDALIVSLLSVLPRKPLARAMGTVAGNRLPSWLNRLLLHWYVRHYQVDLSICDGDLSDFGCLDDLFTRRLLPGARPVEGGATDLLAPADSVVAACGLVQHGRIPQSRGLQVDLDALLAGPHPFEGGAYAVFYLSPPDYHRVHLPITGKLLRWTYRPGRLFPVFPASAARVPHLYARNERLTAWLETDAGTVAIVMIGAFGVGRISAVFTDVQSNRGHPPVDEWPEKPRVLLRGDELGTFHLGSTVLLFFQAGRARLALQAGQRVRVRSRIGELV